MGTAWFLSEDSTKKELILYWQSVSLVRRARLLGVLIFTSLLLLVLGCKDITSQTEILRNSSGVENSRVPLGEAGKVDNFEVTVLGVRTTNARDDEARNSKIRIENPAEDHIYMLVDVMVENIGDESWTVSSRQQINLFDSDRETQNWALIPISKGTVDGRISPGRERRGELVWEVREDAVGLTLVFGETVFTIGDASDFRSGPSDGTASLR